MVRIAKNYFISITKSQGFLLLIVIFYLANGICYIRMQSITSDESSFLNYASKIIHRHPERTDPASQNSKMPIVVLNLVPRMIEQIAKPGLHRTDHSDTDILRGRYITLFLSVFIIIIVYNWTNILYGTEAALICSFPYQHLPKFNLQCRARYD